MTATGTAEAARRGTPAPAPPGRSSPHRAPAGLVAVGGLVALLFASPLAYLAVRNAGHAGDFLDVVTSDRALDPLRTTLLLAGSVAGACAVLGTALAWITTRTDLPLRRLWRVLVALPLVVPSFVGALALVGAFARGGLLDELIGFGTLPRIEGFWAAFVTLTLFSYPYVYLPVSARLAGLPASLEESARGLGRSPGAVFRTVVLPQATGAVWAGSLLVFLYVVSDFGAVSLLRVDTLTTRIDSARLFDPTTALALGLLLGVVALTVVAAERGVARRRLHTEVGASGRPALRTPLGRWKPLATAFVGAVVGVALVAPLAVLGHWTWRGFRGDGRAGPGLELGSLVSPTLRTAGVAVVAAVVTVAVVLPVAYLTTRYRSRAGGPVNALVVGGFALPGLVIALALVFWVLQAPVVSGLYQTLPLLVFAYVVHFGAQAMRASQVAVSGVPRRVEDAARSLGAGRLRRLATVEIPLMLPGLAAGAGLVLLSTMKELPATLYLAPIGFETLATRIWGATADGFLAEAGLLSLALVAISGILTWLLTIRRMERL